MSTELHSSESVAVIGAGSIGAAWAIVFAGAGVRVNLHDTDSGRLGSGRTAIRARLADLNVHGLAVEPADAVLARIEFMPDLDSRGGIAQHAERMGPAYERMGRERGQDDPWTADLVAQVAAERRAVLPLEGWEERVAWRDRALMALLRCRRSDPALEELDPRP